MDLSSAFGMDLTSAARMAGRAMEDPEKGMMLLQRSIGALNPSQREAIKNFEDMGNLAGAQGVILEALAVKVGGTSEAMRNTLGGALTEAGHNIKDMIEELGETQLGAALKA